MGKNYADWAELRDHLIDAFDGTAPTAPAEAEIINVYERHAVAVEKAALEIAAQFATGGDIRSPWGLLHYKAGQIATAPRNPAKPASVDREKRIARAEQWLKNAGIHFNSQAEVRDELFHSRGLLADYHGDTALVDRMLNLWTELRPLGELIEHQALEHATKWKTDMARIERTQPSTPSASENSANASTTKPPPGSPSPCRHTNSPPSSTPSKPPDESPSHSTVPTQTSPSSAAEPNSTPPSPASPSTDPYADFPTTPHDEDDIPW